ncbi:AAA ATPase central domain protein [Sulfuricurvum kujiense DSM 16994]|uniref:AAA ATPase central domain protein n=1 Tax=Sulfuricurvum kujiense (strain ATCC BAA-921 / DSM 16994 / JCM 11577 / YK-1) TaxID=709032 RepID=E4U0Y3_SULKY|nr:ATP-binding protein [Sulfuricurvum kujiense]ADR34385.1 AAA ATPase central domain protein [Sulfuricurvum kujiense DSM 16994]
MNTKQTTLDLSINETYYVESHSKELIAYWSLMCIVKLGGMRNFMDDNRIHYDNVADFLGFGEYINSDEPKKRQVVLGSLEKLLRKLEKSPKPSSPILEVNIAKLSSLVGLDGIEQDVLRFVVYLNYYRIFDEATRTIGDLTAEQLQIVLSVLLGRSIEEIKKALSPRGRLAQAGLLSIDRNSSHSMRQKIDVAYNGFIEKMMTCDDDDVESMIKDSVRRCEMNDLTLNDYTHIAEQLNILVPYMREAIEAKHKGVNILLYGRPGTGKTELVKTIAKELDIELFEVSYADEDDDPIDGDRRLRAYRTAQTLLQKKKIILMFDEIEDVMQDEEIGLFGPRKKQNKKGWFNRILENNVVPSVWITNNAGAIDDATIRRFDMVIEIPVPPKAKRREIIQNNSGDFLSDTVIEKIAKNENVSPAIITRAAKVVQAIQDHMQEPSKAFEMIVENTLKAQGFRGLEKEGIIELPSSYDPSFVNTEHDLKALVAGIAKHQSARICLYGAPGTGKSAFGQWIARELDRPFLLKKGSDLMSMWVGGTEKNIARAFKEAMEENAVLIFDEVDSFLQDRRSAKASWEVTQVNEMLVQMENYNGIFIATTNLMDGLDQASLRRFDLKLEFGYLKPQQSLELFTKETILMGIDTISRSVENDIKSLSRLTPGDFAAIRRQSRFSPIITANDLLDRLIDEVKIKQHDDLKKMGFLR